MKIATMLSYAGGFKESARQVSEMEKAGLDMVWVAEAYGFDAPSLMGYLAALTEREREVLTLVGTGMSLGMPRVLQQIRGLS